jgi:DNA-binding NarL/FixJ family response regulator
MPKIRVLVADDHAVLRAGLRLLINTQPDLEAVGEAGDHRQALQLARSLLPDVLTTARIIGRQFDTIGICHDGFRRQSLGTAQRARAGSFAVPGSRFYEPGNR